MNGFGLTQALSLRFFYLIQCVRPPPIYILVGPIDKASIGDKFRWKAVCKESNWAKRGARHFLVKVRGTEKNKPII